MNDLLHLSADIARKRGLTLLTTRDKACKSKIDLAASLILNGPLFIVSGDEWLPSFALPRIIRSQTTQIKEVLGRLYTVRASTCYRLLDSLANTASRGEPILVFNFLHTFYDPDIPLRVRLLKLKESCDELKRLAFYRPVIVMTQEVEGEDHEKFSGILYSVVDRTLSLEPETEQISQPALF